MLLYEESIRVDAPIDRVYEAWTRFEEFPKFLQGVERVELVEEAAHRWEGPGRFRRRHWETRVTEQEPGARVGWVVIGGGSVLLGLRPENGGTRVDFHAEMESGEGHPWQNEEDIQADLERFRIWIEEEAATS